LHSIVEEKDATSAQKKINEVNAGIYLLNWGKVKSFFSELKNNNAQGEYYLTDIVSMGVEKKLNVNSFIIENNEEVFGINSKLHLAEATRILNNRNVKKHMENGVTIVDPKSVWISSETEIGADTIIYPNCYITGKNIIGNHCKIGPFAHLRGDVELGDYVKVGNFVEVKKSKIKSHTNVSHLSYIGDSELGEHVNIGAGTITANYNPITKVKSRTIIKDGANTGSNSVLVAPLTLNKNVNIGAGSVITKDINSNALALTRSPIRVIENWVKD
jgi:bifunctional UDP-N-acetylglucosamine pyrophosphorylase / glucosamine-1-phosphate N-acetyltransferase